MSDDQYMEDATNEPSVSPPPTKQAKLPRVIQFSIKLHRIKPMIWRQFQVPADFTFEKLHHTIQAAMGWRTQHPYKFVMHNPNNPDGKPIEIGDDETISADDWCANLFPENYRTRKYHASTRNINEFFNDEEDSGTYIYDHSNHWEHEFFLEKIFPMDPNETYPKIVAGRRACPPEGSGGPVGYIQFLNIAMDPNHPENEEKLEWLANKGYTEFDPEEFDSKKVEFKPELFS